MTPRENKLVLENPPLLIIKKSFVRPDPDKLMSLQRAQTGHIVDAMDGRGALAYAIKPLDPARAQFVGVAVTVETGPSDNLAILAAVARASRGDCIVAAADAFEGTAVVGDNVAWMARNAGCSAIVIDGMARDLEGILSVGLPVFARGITPNSCVRTGPGRVGFPIVAGGQAVASGDVIVGDRDGVVVIPAAQLDFVLVRLDAIRAAEAVVQARIATGITQLDSMAQLLRSDQVQFVD
jgi:4-hydroxy-4-methyl-2-oxoglutarate aldolase